tara:strand:+ start:6349 stop:8604 length:2256 start_codon:yes stop_codon:yes gene_type:complete
MKKEIINEEDPRTAFIAEIRSYGHIVKESVPDIDVIVRYPAPGEKGGKACWYWYNENEDEYRPGARSGVGVFGNWQTSEKTVWSSKKLSVMSPTETAAFNAQIERATLLRKVEQEESHKRAAIKAQTIWANSDPAPADHPYLARKGIEVHGARIRGETIVLSVTVDGAIMSLQEISPIEDVNKKFMPEGKISGGYYIVEGEGDVVYVAEGFATAASIAEATGAKVYCAYNAGNLLDVTNTAKDQNPDKNVVICGDDDIWKEVNTGRSKGISASEATQCRIVFPIFQDTSTKPVDFNDLHELEGLETVKKFIEEKPSLYVKKADYEDMPQELLSPPGILGDIANFYNVTARAPQPGFAVQTALAIGSIVTARNYRSTKGNHTSLYFLNIAKSGTGKEHGKTVIEEILSKAGLHDYINGSGYTSAGAVFSALLRAPKHITVIDEFGRYLEAAQGNKNTQLMEANTQLMEAIGRCHGTMRPSSYSTMTLTKEKAQEMSDRHIKNPAVTLLCMTTPVAFYANLRSDAVADGFLGRFIIHQSNMPRMVHDDKDMVDVPHKITNWVQTIQDRAGYNLGASDTAVSEPAFITMAFHGDAISILRAYSQECVDMANDLERFNLEALPGRSKEMAMRISMIVQLAIDPHSTTVGTEAVNWAIKYVRFAVNQSAAVLKMKMAGSSFEADKKEVLEAIREAGDNGVSWSDMQKTPPFSKHRKRDMGDIMDALMSAELVGHERITSGKRGRPREAYVAIEGDE